jgi:NADPH2:quinone reductase
MRAAIIETPGQIRVGTLSDPTPKPDELVIRVGACGICGTDLHVADGDSPLVRYPVVSGHELAGEVVAVGSNVPCHTLSTGSWALWQACRKPE